MRKAPCQNAQPRWTVEAAEGHGKSLALAVHQVLDGILKPVHMPIRTAFTTVALEFPPFSPARFKKELEVAFSNSLTFFGKKTATSTFSLRLLIQLKIIKGPPGTCYDIVSPEGAKN